MGSQAVCLQVPAVIDQRKYTPCPFLIRCIPVDRKNNSCGAPACMLPDPGERSDDISFLRILSVEKDRQKSGCLRVALPVLFAEIKGKKYRQLPFVTFRPVGVKNIPPL